MSLKQRETQVISVPWCCSINYRRAENLLKPGVDWTRQNSTRHRRGKHNKESGRQRNFLKALATKGEAKLVEECDPPWCSRAAWGWTGAVANVGCEHRRHNAASTQPDRCVLGGEGWIPFWETLVSGLPAGCLPRGIIKLNKNPQQEQLHKWG